MIGQIQRSATPIASTWAQSTHSASNYSLLPALAPRHPTRRMKMRAGLGAHARRTATILPTQRCGLTVCITSEHEMLLRRLKRAPSTRKFSPTAPILGATIAVVGWSRHSHYARLLLCSGSMACQYLLSALDPRRFIDPRRTVVVFTCAVHQCSPVRLLAKH